MNSMLAFVLAAVLLLVSFSRPAAAGEAETIAAVLEACSAGRHEQGMTLLRRSGLLDARAGQGEPDGFLAAAECLLAQGYRRRAMTFVDQGVAVCSDRHLPACQLRYLRTRAALNLQAGEAAAALDDLAAARGLAAEPLTQAQVLHDLGVAQALSERFTEADSAFRASLMLATVRDDNRLFIANHLNIARSGLDGQSAAVVIPALLSAERALLSASAAPWLAAQWVALGELLFRADFDAGRWTHLDQAMAALNTGRSLAVREQDVRTESFALGHMGRIAEEAGESATALEYTRLAQLKAQSVDALDGLYLWQWQTARLLEQQGLEEHALGSYAQAIDTLELIRPELARRSARHFQAAVVPVFYGMSNLLLNQVSKAADPDTQVAKLRRVRDTIETLKVAEIENYFSDDCVIGDESATGLDQVAADSAVLYPIIFDDRVEILVSTGATMRRFTSQVSRQELARTVLEFRQGLERRPTNRFRDPGRRLYDWLVAPALPGLRDAGVTTLVFVPDGPLRTIPVAAFYDGARFLVEEFAIATTLGMTLTSPRPLARTGQTQILASGITQSVAGFSALPAVQAELDGIRQIYPARQREFRDEAFLVEEVADELSRGRYSIVHIATHGQFKADHRESFLLAYDGRLSMNALEATVGSRRFNNEPIEMLMLSACETAAGDDRAALGLAGVALKAGARSAVATLWAINDDATAQLVLRFYAELSAGNVTKAEALRAAQLQLIRDQRYAHPAVWAPFLMLGNWL